MMKRSFCFDCSGRSRIVTCRAVNTIAKNKFDGLSCSKNASFGNGIKQARPHMPHCKPATDSPGIFRRRYVPAVNRLCAGQRTLPYQHSHVTSTATQPFCSCKIFFFHCRLNHLCPSSSVIWIAGPAAVIARQALHKGVEQDFE